MYSLYPVTMDTETLDTEALDRQSVEILSTETQPEDGQSIEGNSLDRQIVDDEQIVDAEPGITVVSVTIQLPKIPAVVHSLVEFRYRNFDLNFTLIYHAQSLIWKPCKC